MASLCIHLSRHLRQLFQFQQRRTCTPDFIIWRNAATKVKNLDKILIANRGEIACRVIRTCKEMGIKTVAIYSDADSQALHVRMADEAVRVGPPVAAESYLNMDAIFTAIEETGAKAVHPGYGFLSENEEFARELSKRGVVFIGPNTHAIHVMGDKLESKRTALSANVNTIPGFDGIVKDTDEAIKLAQEIGYPVMVKASAGGGGKGMRIAWNDKEILEGFVLATEEAMTAVKDGRLLIEKFIDNPRHIEIQVLGDQHGNVVYLNERECSIQRRNQKVIEEAPSTFLDPETRRSMGEQAVALAKSVQYESAGTVEFLVDSQKNFYFLEMNTRLQVEHPVTEIITGTDLVKEMINVASGLPLSFSQKDIGINGWAIEARVYAEDPVRFLPSIGFLSHYMEPTGKPGLENVRVDTGIVEGSTISMFYDPMISKLVTYGPTRDFALKVMAKALDNYCIKGVRHNVPLLRDIINQPQFISGDISTNFIQEVYPDGFTGRMDKANKNELIAVAAYMHIKRTELAKRFCNQKRQITDYNDDYNTFDLVVSTDSFSQQVTVEKHISNFSVMIEDQQLEIFSDWEAGDTMMNATINGEDITVHFEGRNSQLLFLRYFGQKYSVAVYDNRQDILLTHVPKKLSVSQAHILRAPMPGVVKSIACTEGNEVEEGTIIVTLEAMKMQNPLFAPMTGKVR